jgi:hypothetical protein
MWCVINISMSIHWNFQVVCVWFDWDYYYDAHPDVVQANMDMATHWKEFGFYQGRAGSFQFDPVFYWNTPPDLLQAYGSPGFGDALHHWITVGKEEGCSPR